MNLVLGMHGTKKIGRIRMRMRKLIVRTKSLGAVLIVFFMANASPVSADWLDCRALIESAQPCEMIHVGRRIVGTYNNGCTISGEHATDGSSTSYPRMMGGLVNNAIAHGYWTDSLQLGGPPSVHFNFNLHELMGFIYSPNTLPGSSEVSVRVVKADIFDSIRRKTKIDPNLIVLEQRFLFEDIKEGSGTLIEKKVTVTLSTPKRWVIVIGQNGKKPDGAASWNENTTVCRMPIISKTRAKF